MTQPVGVYPQSYFPPDMTNLRMSGMESSTMPRGEIPTPEEVVPLLQNQSGLVHQLETENAYLKVSSPSFIMIILINYLFYFLLVYL